MTQSLTSILITSKITKTCNPLNAYPVHIYPPEFDFWLDYAQLTWVECAWRLPAANHQQSAAAPCCIVYMHNMRYIYIYYIWYYICMYVCRGAVSWPEIESEPRTTAMAAHCLGVTHWFRAIPVARASPQRPDPSYARPMFPVLACFWRTREMQPSTSVIRAQSTSYLSSCYDCSSTEFSTTAAALFGQFAFINICWATATDTDAPDSVRGQNCVADNLAYSWNNN